MLLEPIYNILVKKLHFCLRFWGFDINSSVVVSKTTGNVFGTPGADCKSRNLIYCATCLLCQKQYTGRTVTKLQKRICGHRSHLDDEFFDDESDEATLVEHLSVDHNFKVKPRDNEESLPPGDGNFLSSKLFNSSYQFTVLELSPHDIDRAEQRWISKLLTMRPFGLNKEKPCGVTDSVRMMCRRSLGFMSQR